jgi:hypothetical protein
MGKRSGEPLCFANVKPFRAWSVSPDAQPGRRFGICSIASKFASGRAAAKRFGQNAR